jgi:cyclophilin family peptidyl-prolyl cis-trans isomerase
MAKRKITSQQVKVSQKRRQKAENSQRRRRTVIIIVAVLAAVLITLGVVMWQTRSSSEVEQVARPLDGVEPADRNEYFSEYPEMVIDPSRSYEATIRTAKGDIELRLFDDEAPLAVNNFVYLANQGFYDGLTFHRVIEDFMAQGGDPTGFGIGGPGYTFADETDNNLRFDRAGLLAMANSGPSTNGSQFFITYVPTPHLDGLHTIFGEVTAGEDVLNSLSLVQPGEAGDVIERIDIVEK